jgi:UDP-N-acetylglucosamine 2-epimerase (non-hydrolysing)
MKIMPWRSTAEYERTRALTLFLTGNTVVDALRWTAPGNDGATLRKLAGEETRGQRLVLVTCYWRESFGAPMRRVATAIEKVARTHNDVIILFPFHPNPEVQSIIVPRLGSVPNVVLCPPRDYDPFHSALKHAYFVRSDSVGVPEEATTPGKPVLVLRGQTERRE